MEDAIDLDNRALLTQKRVMQIISVSYSTLYRRWKSGQFPKPMQINSRNYWRKDEVANWILAQGRAA